MTRLQRAARVLAIGAILTAAAPAFAQRGLEYDVKAAFVYNFIKFIEWPADAVPAGDSFRVCLVGEDPFGGALERAIGDDKVDGRPIAVQRVAPEAVSQACQIVFVPRAQAKRSAAIARALATAPVLIVGESDGFLQAGGAINLVVDGGHVRFDVSLPQAAARNLKISSKLLRVARNAAAPPREQR